MQAPSTVNNCAREMMRAIRVQWEDAGWFDWGLTETLKAKNQIRVASSSYTVSEVYPVGSRVKVVSSDATVYGTVASLSSSSTAVILDITCDSGTITSTVTSVAASIISPNNSPIPSVSADAKKNFIINSNFQINQRGGTFTSASWFANSDDSFLLDNWNLLSDGNDIVDVSQETSTVPASGRAIKLEVETANAKFGVVQFIENKDAIKLIGQTVSLQFKARNAASDDNTNVVKAAILSWASTADSLTSDVVSAWNADVTTPTFATNWTAENTPSSLTLTQSYQTFTIENIAIDTSSTNNVAVFIWCDNADGAVDDAVYISDVKLEISSKATPYVADIFQEDLKNCQRYFQKSPPYGDVVGTASLALAASRNSIDPPDNGYIAVIRLAEEMRASPSVVTYPYTTPANTSRWSDGGGTDYAANSAVPASIHAVSIAFQNQSGGALTLNANDIIIGQWYATANL